MKNGTISRALTTSLPLELEYRQPSLQERGIGVESSMSPEIGKRALIDELAAFANSVWA